MSNQLREALVIARAGLAWYQENYPETFSECDNEALEQIDAALASQQDHIPDVGKMVQSQAQQEPSKDIHEAITLLSAVFDAWENGTDCYDDFDGVSGSFIGKAFNLDDEIFKRCCDLLNRVNPPRNVSQAQQTESKWISVDERLPEMAQKVFGIYDAGMCAFMRVRSEDDTWCWAIGRNDLYDDFFYDADDDYQVTHWMPLPPAPEGDKP